MAIKQINMPSLWASAIVNHDYSLLDKDDIKALNKELLNNDVSFCDCVECSEPLLAPNGLRFKSAIKMDRFDSFRLVP